MEQQRILDRQEWSKKEQELLNHRQQMMETLIETKDQLTNVLKAREENKAREAFYQKQLQQQQLQQLQQQSLQIQQQQQQQQQQDEESEVEEDSLPSQQLQQNFEYYAQQQHTMPEDYEDDRRVNRMRSEEYIRPYNSRSSSRASSHPSHYQQAPPPPQEEGGRKSAVSRRNSNASNKSGVPNRFDPSPSTTLVATTPQRMHNRRRAKSIESSKYHNDPAGPIMYDAPQPQYYVSNRPRRSRSVGRRPSSVVYNDYYEDDTEDDYSYYDNSPRYNSKHNYNTEYYAQQPYTNNDMYAGDYYSPRHPFPPLQPQQQQMQFHPPHLNRQGGGQRYAAPPRHYTYN
jgi:hypothetical protein